MDSPAHLKPIYSSVRSELRGARDEEKQFERLSVSDDLWAGVSRTNSFFSQIGEVFTKQSVGDRLFIDAIYDDRPVTPSFYDGLKVQEVIDAAIASYQRGCWVSL